MKDICFDCAYWLRDYSKELKSCYFGNCPARIRDKQSDFKQRQMKIYKFLIKNPKQLPLHGLAARAKISNNENTGFFIYFKHQKPILHNVIIRKEALDTYGLFFECDDMDSMLLKKQLVSMLGAKQVIKIA